MKYSIWESHLYYVHLLHEFSKIKDFITHKFYLLYITCTKYAYLQENQNMTRLKFIFYIDY